MLYLLSFLSTATLSWFLTLLVRRFALRAGIADKPDSPRKIHPNPTPLLGGLAIFGAFWIVIGVLALFSDALPARYVAPDFLWGIFIAGALLMLGGFLDDRFALSARWQIVFPVLAALAVVASGIGIDFVGNPFGEGLLHLDRWKWEFGSFAGRALTFVLLADLFTVVWLLGMMYTTKFLDGLDGLVSGITTMAAFILFALSLTDKTFQPDVALLAISLAGAAFGFLLWNVHPARIFLGEGGSVWTGFMLGMLAIISGGKVATALLIMGVPILDVVWVIARRLFFEKRSPAAGDALHLHFRLLSAGFSHRKAVMLLWGLSAFFGVTSLLFQTEGKVYLLAVLALVMLMLALWVTRRSKSSRQSSGLSSSL